MDPLEALPNGSAFFLPGNLLGKRRIGRVRFDAAGFCRLLQVHLGAYPVRFEEAGRDHNKYENKQNKRQGNTKSQCFGGFFGLFLIIMFN